MYILQIISRGNNHQRRKWWIAVSSALVFFFIGWCIICANCFCLSLDFWHSRWLSDSNRARASFKCPSSRVFNKYFPFFCSKLHVFSSTACLTMPEPCQSLKKQMKKAWKKCVRNSFFFWDILLFQSPLKTLVNCLFGRWWVFNKMCEIQRHYGHLALSVLLIKVCLFSNLYFLIPDFDITEGEISVGWSFNPGVEIHYYFWKNIWKAYHFPTSAYFGF